MNILNFKEKADIVGTIINKNILDNQNLTKKINKECFSLLVLGGSQGAEIFGKIIPSVIKMIKEKGYEIQINQQFYQLLPRYIDTLNLHSYQLNRLGVHL